MKKKCLIIIFLILFIIIALIVVVSYDKLKIDLKNLINNKYESVTLDCIATDNNKLYIYFYVEDEKESIGDSFEIRNTVKDYLKKHDEYKNMRVEICLQSYSQDFSITFANYDDYRTGINFENSYDINFGWFNCTFITSLSDFEGVKGIEDFEILGFFDLYDYHDVSALDSVRNLKYLFFPDYSYSYNEINTYYDYLVRKHSNCKIEIHDSEHLEQTDKLEPEPYHLIIEEVNNEKK